MVDDDPETNDARAGGEQRDPYLDTAERLEYSIDKQIAIMNGIDDKAEHVTRLVGILIGLVFTVLSLVANFDPADFERLTAPSS